MSDNLPAPVDPTPATPGVPAGWYADPSTGLQRWWNGLAWTNDFAPVAAPTAPPGSTNGAAIPALVLGIVGFVLIPIPLFIGLFLGGIPALLAVIFGIVGMVTANRLHNLRMGASLAGFLLGAFALVLALFGAGTIW